MKIVSLGSSYYLIWLLGTAPPNSYASSLPNLTALGIPAVSPVSSIMIQIYLFSGNPAGFCFSTLQLTGSLAILWAKEISLGTRATQPLLAFCYNRFHTHVSTGLQLAPGPKVYWNLCCDSAHPEGPLDLTSGTTPIGAEGGSGVPAGPSLSVNVALSS